MDRRAAELRETPGETLGEPTFASMQSFYPSRKWSPFAPPGVEEGKPVRLQLYARDRGAFRARLDVVHRASAEPLLELQVTDDCGKRRARAELAECPASHPGRDVREGDPWCRRDGREPAPRR